MATNTVTIKNSKAVYINNMIPGSKGHVFYACIKIHDFGTRKT